MQRRRALLLTLTPLALAACGFQLRQAPKFGFQSLQLDGGTTPVVVDLRRALNAAGMRLVAAPPPRPPESTDPLPEGPDVRLQVLQDQRERVVVGQTASGQIRELQLRTRFRFRVTTPQGRELIPDTELLQTRDISFTETQVLGKEAEEALMYKDMQSDIAQQVMRRLSAVRL